MKRHLIPLLLAMVLGSFVTHAAGKPRVIVTSDGEIDDECSLVRFLLYANEWDIEGIITSSSQYHWQGHRWAGDDWAQPYLKAYAEVHPNLVQHDPAYPAPEYLQERTLLGNVKAEGEMEEVTPGSQRIVEVLLDDSDPRSVWLQAWGGCNTIARALKTIQEAHPEKMAEISKKVRLFLIWEQDPTYQNYYSEASSYGRAIEIRGSQSEEALIEIPKDARSGDSMHVVCEVTDHGTPPLTRYQRVVVEIK